MKKSYSIILLFIFSISLQCIAQNKPNSNFEGVQVGVITYSFRSMSDQSIEAILNYAVESGLSSVELMGGAVETYAGKPDTKDREVIKKWRTSVSMDPFVNIRNIFDEKGVRIDLLKLGAGSWSDEEIDYVFEVCKILGARGITREISEEAAKRLAPFAQKHNLYVAFHNHAQPAQPGFSFDKILSYGKMLMLNFDVGHYFGATGLDPCDLIERLHDRIASIHIKDKTGPNTVEPNKNREFGKGQTPVVEILQLIQKNRWPITCDIELEYPIPQNSDAVKEIEKCVEYCRKALVSK